VTDALTYAVHPLAQAAPPQGGVLWIVLAVVLALILVALIVGLVVSRRRKVSLREEQQPPSSEAPRERYRSTGQITFSAGTGTVDKPRPAAAEPRPPAPAPPAPAPKPAEPAPPVAPPPADTAEAVTGTEAPTADPAAPPGTTAPRTAPPTGPKAAEPAALERPAPAPPAPAKRTAPAKPPAPAKRTAPAPTAPAKPTAPSAPAGPETAKPTAPVAPMEPIEPSERRLERLRGRLAGSRSAFGQSLLGLLGGGDLDEDSWEEVEDTLLMADLGAQTTTELVDTLRTEVAARGVRTPEQARALLKEVLTAALAPELDRSVRALPHDGRPAVVLVAGVNGTGKTTTTGKLARVLVGGGRTVVLGAADTFRAAAAEQLVTWGERSGAVVVRGPEGADPASVAFDAVKRAVQDGADAVLLDTAGRLHTKTGLMDELGKVKRVVSRQGDVDEVLLVLDATTGQNGLVQAKVFAEVIDVTGIVLTKLDGTAKGGIVFRVQRELGVPVKLVGLGEGIDDLAPFEPAAFVDALLA
jgi:fused signal recognition particle receptor